MVNPGLKKAIQLLLLILFQWHSCCAWTSRHAHRAKIWEELREIGPDSFYRPASGTSLQMGLWDSVSNFLSERDGEFVKLETSNDAYGPGPLLVLYQIPVGIEDDEIQDMLSDGAPQAFQSGCRLFRLEEHDTEHLKKPLSEFLDKALHSIPSPPQRNDAVSKPAPIPVLLFSGFQNREMMDAFKILEEEIYAESGGQSSPACAKAVPNAMHKSLGLVIEGISGDHFSPIGLNA